MNVHLIHKIIKPIRLIGLLSILSVILAACAPAATLATTPAFTQPAGTPTGAAASPPTIDIAADPTLGQYLVDSSGRTLYIFTKDSPDSSNCDASCLALWPPLLSSGTPKAGPGVDAALVGVATLSNGEEVATYDHRPLYYAATDVKIGDKTGEAIGNVWYMVSPSGTPVTGPSPAMSTPAATVAPTTSPTAAPANANPAATPTNITEPSIDVANISTLGHILVANNGMTLYAYTLDKADTSNCGATCQKVWIPLLTLGHPDLANGVTASFFGTTTLADGKLVVTYNHMPLYFFVDDTAAGQTNGQGFDNVWFAVSPDGKLVGNVSEVSIGIATNPIVGNFLVGQGGQAIFVYTKDTADTSTCTGACLANWPPVLTLGKPNLGSGVDATMIGTIKLPDGSLMLSYNHKPLYYFVGDAKPTDIKGQGVKGVWNLIGADGNNITTPLPQAPASEPTLKVTTHTTFGQILTDGNGMTLYILTLDFNGQSSCDDLCLQYWTPLFTLGHPNIGAGVNASLVGTVTTAYGLRIVTYNKQPLYLFKSDKNPGDAKGQGFINTWYVISVSGQAVTK